MSSSVYYIVEVDVARYDHEVWNDRASPLRLRSVSTVEYAHTELKSAKRVASLYRQGNRLPAGYSYWRNHEIVAVRIIEFHAVATLDETVLIEDTTPGAVRPF